MADHDQRFKQLLREFFAEFLRLFFPEVADRLDLSAVEWLDQELFLDPPQGAKRRLDLVAKVPARDPIAAARAGEPAYRLALLHVEAETDATVPEMRERMLEYYWYLRRKHRLPVLPVVLYLRVGLDGIGVDTYVEEVWGAPVLAFTYRYIGLPGLDGEAYKDSANLLGVALSALMKIRSERRVEAAAEALDRVVQSTESPWRKFLLADCIQAYAPLEPA